MNFLIFGCILYWISKKNGVTPSSKNLSNKLLLYLFSWEFAKNVVGGNYSGSPINITFSILYLKGTKERGSVH